jgi:nicotinamidase/pyrazinamidase
MDHIFDIIVDAQHDFMRSTGKLEVKGAEAIISALQQHVSNLDNRGVLFTYDTHLVGVYEQSEEAKQFPIHCIKDSEGWQLVVDPSTARVPISTLEKGVFDMWHESGLIVRPLGMDRDAFFADLMAAGVTTLRIAGVAADYCVKWAIDGALARGFAIEVVAGLTVGIERTIEQVIADEFGQAVTVVQG